MAATIRRRYSIALHGLHSSARHPFRSTPAAPHVSRPPASARWETGLALPGVPGTVGIPYAGFLYITAVVNGCRC